MIKATIALPNCKKTCDICSISVVDGVNLGNKYILGDLVVHFHCVLLSRDVKRRGAAEEGVQGFLQQDILNLVRKSSRVTCVYCSLTGASVLCRTCSTSFHLPCGLFHGAVMDVSSSPHIDCDKHRAEASKVSPGVSAPVTKNNGPKGAILLPTRSVSKCNLCSAGFVDGTNLGHKYKWKGLVFHYNCLRLSTNLKKRIIGGNDLCGIAHQDILNIVQKSSRVVCAHCGYSGASIQCPTCTDTFHLPCGLLSKSLSLFGGNPYFSCSKLHKNHLRDDAGEYQEMQGINDRNISQNSLIGRRELRSKNIKHENKIHSPEMVKVKVEEQPNNGESSFSNSGYGKGNDSEAQKVNAALNSAKILIDSIVTLREKKSSLKSPECKRNPTIRTALKSAKILIDSLVSHEDAQRGKKKYLKVERSPSGGNSSNSKSVPVVHTKMRRKNKHSVLEDSVILVTESVSDEETSERNYRRKLKRPAPVEKQILLDESLDKTEIASINFENALKTNIVPAKKVKRTITQRVKPIFKCLYNIDSVIIKDPLDITNLKNGAAYPVFQTSMNLPDVRNIGSDNYGQQFSNSLGEINPADLVEVVTEDSNQNAEIAEAGFAAENTSADYIDVDVIDVISENEEEIWRASAQTSSATSGTSFVPSEGACCVVCMLAINSADGENSRRAPCCDQTWYHLKCLQVLYKLGSKDFSRFECPVCSNGKEYRSWLARHGMFKTLGKVVTGLKSINEQVPEASNSQNSGKSLTGLKSINEQVPEASNSQNSGFVFPEKLLWCSMKDCFSNEGRGFNLSGTQLEMVKCRVCNWRGVHKMCAGSSALPGHWVCVLCTLNSKDNATIPDESGTFNKSEKFKIKKCRFASCEKVFADLAIFNSHELVHSGAQRFECGYTTCDMDFGHREILRKHERIHTNRHACQYCFKVFATGDFLKRHVARHYGASLYKCNYCPTAYSKYNSYYYHMLTHTVAGPEGGVY